jgi:hypothetical protein
MEQLYKFYPAKSYQSTVPLEPEQVVELGFRYNRESLAQEWTPLSYRFVDSDDGKNLQPSICSQPSTILFRAELLHAIFPSPCVYFEFLPVVVGSENWLSLNCLKTTLQYDPKRSLFMRSPRTADIAFIRKLVVQDPSVRECEIFTLADSNRATLIVLQSFKRRIEELKVGGISFENIGTLEAP